MKILLLDIETAPNLAYVWGMWQQNISMDKIVANGHVLCWSAKWYGKRGMHFRSVRGPGGARGMLRQVHSLLDEADAVVHYNGSSFDIPTLNKEFLTHGMTPPAPYKQIDLLTVVRDRFRFPINKLDYVVQQLGLGRKVRHPGFQMWIDCMAGDERAWDKMARYNQRDVVILERLYEKLKPWVRNHPNVAVGGVPDACPRCGVRGKLQRRGLTSPTSSSDSLYQRFQCGGCGGWLRGRKAVARATVTLRGVS